MDEVPFQDWPVDPEGTCSGTHSWTPAYGLQTPSALLEKEDFIGNPDAEYFFQGSSFSSNYNYLETIQEETSDDLVSSHGSSYSDSHCHSPVGWLATDSDSGSVVCVENNEADCESDREIACPAKRRKQDIQSSQQTQTLTVPDLDECETSLSRSSSLLQFETLEKQCQLEPPQSLTLSYDSLELTQSGDSSNNTRSRDSLLYNGIRSKSDSGESTTSSESSDTTTLNGSRSRFDSRSLDNLRTWRSFGSLPQLSNGSTSKRFSSENLSEDSGFGDQINGKSASSIGSLKKESITLDLQESDMHRKSGQKNSYVGFGAYDGDVFQNFTGNFGVSYQDLTNLERYEPLVKDAEYPVSKNSPLTDRFLQRVKQRQQQQQQTQQTPFLCAINLHALIKLERDAGQQSNFVQKNVVSHAASVPDLQCASVVPDASPVLPNSVLSVPKDLNFIGDLQQLSPVSSSVAEKNWNLADWIRLDFVDDSNQTIQNLNEDSLISKKNLEDMGTNRQKREGSYTRAMDNRVDLSDDENSLCFKKRLPNNPIVEFDRRVLKAISEQSLQSLRGSQNVLDNYIQYEEPSPPRQKRKIGYSATFSTPDLNRIEPTRKREQKFYYDNDRTKSNLEISKVDELAMLEIAKLDKIIKDVDSKSKEYRPSNQYVVERPLAKDRPIPSYESKLDDIKLQNHKKNEEERPVAKDRSTHRYETNVDYIKIDNHHQHEEERSVAKDRATHRYETNVDDIKIENHHQYEEETPVAKDRSTSRYETNVDEIIIETDIDCKPKDEMSSNNNIKKHIENNKVQNLVHFIEMERKIASTAENNILDCEDEPDCRNSLLEVGSLPVIQEQIERKGSIIKSSTSTSGMSDIETDRTLRNSVKSFSGSAGSKGVHFSPVVAEVNWRDDISGSTATPERESSYSLDSSPSPDPIRNQSKYIKPRPRYPHEKSPVQQSSRRSVSQPDLSDTEGKFYKREFLDSLHNLRQQDLSKSQPEISKHKRRGSQLIKKDSDGCTIKAYVDLDGVQYRHTHLKSSGGNVAQSPSEHQDTFTPHQSKQPIGSGRTYVGMTTDDHHGDLRTPAMSTPQFATSAAKKKGLGGFLQRLASFRLGARKSRDQHNKSKKATSAVATSTLTYPSNDAMFSSSNDMSATKPNYIYIPLKGPPSVQSNMNNNNNNITSAATVSASKPPLPKQPPPRVVHASAKRNQDGGGRQLRGATAAATIDPGAHVRRWQDEIDDGQSEYARRSRCNRATNLGNAVGSMETPMGLIETDLDTEVTVITNAKARSLLNLGEPRLSLPPEKSAQGGRRPHKSMEFLLDKENHKVVEPPENELQKTERVMSEHELRVQRSLQKLTIPEWYKQNQVPQQGFLLKKHSTRDTRWTGTGCKTTSLSSLGSPQVLSPTPSLQQPFVRWSTSKLNSTASSPCQSTRSSFNQGRHQPTSNGSVSPCSSARSSFSYRQPYLGWRSQERLNRTPRTPAERLASSLLAQQHNQNHHNHQQESPEIQTSIKEVTSAIVHYVKGLKPHDLEDRLDQSRSNSVSPRGSQKFCWLESSFVGSKPLDSPETPLTCSESPVPPSLSQNSRLELLQGHHQSNNEISQLEPTQIDSDKVVRPSPSSTTLEDVLDSLLGLPSTGRAASPCLVQETRSASTSPRRRSSDISSATCDASSDPQYRRRSEGSEPYNPSIVTKMTDESGKLSSPAILRCRYSRCGKTIMATSREAKGFKNCHNCTYTYCSRACRRNHWERHRKTCLFSRIGTLCRQVIAAAKEDKDSLKVLSKVARRGYLSHGPGAVKCFYPNPESGERFLAQGLSCLGELTYVRWQDLLPSEMGPQLYEEMVTMCKNYNPDSKLVLYVSICVVSETPASGAVKWERQLVSRCAKIKLSRENIQLLDKEIMETAPETVILTCPPIRLPTKEISIKARRVAVENLYEQLRERGMSIKRHYPDLYRRLETYCSDLTIKFGNAITLYPKSTDKTRRCTNTFMCIIMLESDPEQLKKVERAGVKVRTIDVLLASETTAL